MKKQPTDPETSSFEAALEAKGYEIVSELEQSSTYARSFKAVKGESVFCVKTVDTRPGHTIGSEARDQAALVKMSKEVASVSFAFHKIPRDEKLCHDIASIEEDGIWKSPVTRMAIPWYAQRWIEGEELTTYWPGRVRDLQGQEFFDVFLRAARSLMEIVSYIHDYQVAHGDIWQKNIKVREPEGAFRLALIDFAECFFPGQVSGLASSTGATLPQSNTVFAPEERMGRKVSFQTDIYHLGETLLFLASKGRYRPSAPKPEVAEVLQHNLEQAATELTTVISTKQGADLKGEILTILKKHEGQLDHSTTARSQRDALKTEVENAVDETLKNLVPGVIDVILLCKVGDLNLRASSVFEVRNLLETYARANKRAPLADVQESTERIRGIIKQHCDESTGGRGSNFLTQMLSLELERVRWRLQAAVRTKTYEIAGLRGDCIQGLLDFLSLLEPKDQYIATTIPSLWTSRGLGNEGRFYRLNMEMALNGIAIKRVFVIERGTLGKFAKTYSKLHESQTKLTKILRAKGLYSSQGASFDNQQCFIGVAEVERAQLDEWGTAGFNVGLARFRHEDPERWEDVQLYIRPTNEYLRRLDLKHVEAHATLLHMQTIFSAAVSIDDPHHLGA